MSLHIAAKHLASKGRGPDTHLVHMAPSEVAGLQALAKAHGGSLTINPDTGLPEAGVLSSLLPMILGAAITATTGIPAWAVGLGIGGLETARTGNLGKGLMAGLGGFGGAGLASGLMGAGAAGMNDAAQQAILNANAGGTAANSGMMTANEIGREMGQQGFVQPQIAASANPATASAVDKMSAGLGNLGAVNKMDMARYGLAAALPAMTQQTPAQYQGSGPNPYEYTYDYKTGQYTRVPTGTRDKFPMTPNVPMMAAGGVTHLGDYSDGGRLLKGPGDGVSDSIPATIGDKRPARLADGEFVVPARIVSELGNGSTEAGARKLYAMMDRIQKARAKTTGKERVAVNSRADKALPA